MPIFQAKKLCPQDFPSRANEPVQGNIAPVMEILTGVSRWWNTYR